MTKHLLRTGLAGVFLAAVVLLILAYALAPQEDSGWFNCHIHGNQECG